MTLDPQKKGRKKVMKKMVVLLAVLMVVFMCTAACQSQPAAENTQAASTPAASETVAQINPQEANVKTFPAPPANINVATIETSKGVIKFKFYPKDAPQSVANFIDLAQKGFYNGLSFHRVEPGFVIQGGDPNGNGTGGPGYSIKAEFNSQKHLEGTVAMARSSDPNSAGSQFYICLAPAPFLDNNYTVFGQVISGMDVVKKIAIGDKMIKVTVGEK
jgi:peptidyl-prolyl cis-trans isomerase B (cyclophilin B)